MKLLKHYPFVAMLLFILLFSAFNNITYGEVRTVSGTPDGMSEEIQTDRANDLASTHMEKDEYIEAIVTLLPLVRSTQADVRSYFLITKASNRIMLWETADRYGKKALDLGMDTSEMWYERGYTFAAQERYGEAFDALSRADLSDIHVAYRMGIVAMIIGAWEEAKQAFEQAKTSPEYEKRASARLKLLDQVKSGTTNKVKIMIDFVNNLELSGEIDLPLGEMASREGKTSLDVSVSGSYSDNVVAMNRDAALPAEISQRSDESLNLDISGSHILYSGPDRKYGINFNAYRSFYSTLDEFDLTYVVPGLFATKYSGNFIYQATLNPSYSMLGDDSFTKGLEGALGLIFEDYSRSRRTIRTGLLLRLPYLDYIMDPPSDDQDRTGFYPQLILRRSVYLPQKGMTGSGDIFYEYQDTQGTSYKGDLAGVELNGEKGLPYGCTLKSGLAYKINWFDHANPLSENNDERKDKEFRFFTSMEKSFKSEYKGFVRYEYTNHHSNISQVYGYKENAVFLGITIDFRPGNF